MHIGHRTDDHFPRKAEEPRNHNAMRNVRRQDSRSIWADHRNLERDKSIRKWVEVPAPSAPGVRETHIGALAESIVSRNVRLAIVLNPGVPQSQRSGPSCNSDHLIKKEEFPALAVKIASPEVKILPELMFEHDVPTERARARSRVARCARRTRGSA